MENNDILNIAALMARVRERIAEVTKIRLYSQEMLNELNQIPGFKESVAAEELEECIERLHQVSANLGEAHQSLLICEATEYYKAN